MRPIRFADLAITPWRNGAGRKADIATGEGWLAGFAFLDQDAPFSDYADHDRTITLIDGPGFELEIAGQGVIRVDQPYVPHRFDGGASTTCRLLGGPCRVLNAMTARGDHAHGVEVSRGTEFRLHESAVEVALLVVLQGAATVSAGHRAIDLGMLDTVWRDTPVGIAASADAVFCQIEIANRKGAGLPRRLNTV